MEERKGLWALLTGSQQVDLPWLVVGDFNAVFEFDDRIGGRPVTELEVEDSSLWRANAMLSKIHLNGSHFTWSNKQKEGSRIFSKLDRCFVNEKLINALPDSEVRINWDTISNHYFCIIKTVQFQILGVRPFRFFNMWTKDKDFRNEVLSIWSKQTGGTGLFQITQKIRRLKPMLSKFNQKQIGDVVQLYAAAKMNYEKVQLLLQQSPESRVLQQEEQEARDDFVSKSKMYESFLRQKSKINLHHFGDENTAYFHASLKQRRIRNYITYFLNEEGQMIDYNEEVVAHFFNHFKGFLGKGSSATSWADKSYLGDDISEAILQFFEHGEIPAELNSTILSLIPKVVSPVSAVDYRPITCCNTLKNITPRCLIKIDLSKAYDSIDWVFLDDILATFCLPSKFIQWIMICLTDTSYSLMMNGRLQGSFAGRKGLRQGDPISPLLFVLVMEYLTRLLTQISQHRQFQFHPLCKNLQLVNLCFADDLILFCKGTFKSVKLLMEGFLRFSQCSGLSANLTKSHIYFGGVVADVKNNILSSIVIEEGHFPLKYLGVNLKRIRWQVADCSEIIKKLQARLHVWACRHLSFARRTQLIFSVLLGIRNYWMQIFMLPISVIQETDRICCNFLWDANGHRSKFHCSSWSQVCLPKSLGGLGFKEGSNWNKVLLAKFIWVVSSKQDVLWVKWIDSIYLRGQSFWSYQLKPDVSCFSHQVWELTKGWLGSAIWPKTFAQWKLWLEGKPKNLMHHIAVASLAAAVYGI
ncbi:uncharacterized protein LOC133814562 [Humulus lupulus]|uniref:uncharacterized protein LOC133814562 n=1 Tax=Humulus lupulus TaxID=3486 RepID=UPI002B40180F|nr:uncharacterized protein LOC133814562 [Humulus lupulus]